MTTAPTATSRSYARRSAVEARRDPDADEPVVGLVGQADAGGDVELQGVAHEVGEAAVDWAGFPSHLRQPTTFELDSILQLVKKPAGV